MKNKFIATIADALRQCGLADGMTLSFHHHLRNGDHVVNMTMDAVATLGVKNITVACSSLFPVHEHLVQHKLTRCATRLWSTTPAPLYLSGAAKTLPT